MITDANKYFVLQYGKLNIDDHIEKYPYEMASRCDLEPRHVDQLLNSNDIPVRWKVAGNRNLHSNQIDRIVDDEDSRVRSKIARHPKLQDNQIKKLISDQDSDVRISIANSKNLNNEHFELLSHDPDIMNKRIISKLHQEFLAKNQVSK